jgi:CheY-like chemotaxis protein
MKTALIIDDNRETADAIGQMLGFLNLEPHIAYGPRSAMMILKDLSPDIIFLDISMPGVDGFEVMSYLRRSPQLHQVPIIIITADNQPETARKVQQNGGLMTIIKPVTLEILENALLEARL